MTVALSRDTIVATATPPGRGALAIVRLSGPQALEIGAAVVRPWPASPRHAAHARAYEASGDPADDVMVTWFRAPHSFTGEDAVEVTCHGGSVAPALTTTAFVSRGARPALPGEFTRRAVLNGRLDLLQAEAVGDLVDATTRAAQRVAMLQLDGGLSRRIARLRDHIVQVEALSAYDIDFPEEDDGPIPAGRILEAAAAVMTEIDALLATAPVGEIARAGAMVVIAGAPNVGKSSLFNALLGRQRAIVTDVPGTTRDAIEAVTEAGDWPIRLVDTAGWRDSTDTVERIGIEVSREYAGRAAVVLACGDSAAALDLAKRAASENSPAPVIAVWTKADLPGAQDAAHDADVVVSAETGVGIPELLRAVAHALETSNGALSLDAPLVTRERHRLNLVRARDELALFLTVFAGESVPALVAAVHLREATRHLEEVIGPVDAEEVLDRLFSAFCVGK